VYTTPASCVFFVHRSSFHHRKEKTVEFADEPCTEKKKERNIPPPPEAGEDDEDDFPSARRFNALAERNLWDCLVREPFSCLAKQFDFFNFIVFLFLFFQDLKDEDHIEDGVLLIDPVEIAQ